MKLSKRPPFSFAVAALLGVAFTPALCAGTYQWKGGSGGGDAWSIAGNWLENAAPPSDLANTDLIFGAGSVSTPSISPYSIHSLTWSAGAAAYTFDTGPLTLGAGGFTQNAANAQTFSTAQVILGAAQVWTLASGAGALTFAAGVDTKTFALTVSAATTTGSGNVLNGALTGSGSLTQTGPGILTLTGANTYAGATTISAGTLQIGNGSTSGTLGGGSVTDNASLVFNRSDSVSVANAIGGSGTLTQAGTGTITLTATNAYTGTTTISAGTLQIGSGGTSGSLGSGSVTVKTVLAFNRSDDVTVANAIGGTGGLSKLGAGTLTLTGANSYSGLVTVSAGALRAGAATFAFGNLATLVLAIRPAPRWISTVSAR